MQDRRRLQAGHLLAQRAKSTLERSRGDNPALERPPTTVILRHAFIPLDNERLAHLCGSMDEHLRDIEAALDVSITRRNESFRVEGDRKSVV